MADHENQLQALHEIEFLIQELVRLTRIMSYPTIKEILETTLNTEEKKLVYDLLDGDRKIVDIQQLSGVNISNISEWGQEWEKIGIVEPGTRKGRRHKCFDPSMFGLSVSRLSEVKAENSNR